MDKSDLKEARYELNDILKTHDVARMRDFIFEHSEYFEKVPDRDIFSDQYVFDLIHVYKAHLFYFGEDHQRSLKYCIDNGIIKVDRRGSSPCPDMLTLESEVGKPH